MKLSFSLPSSKSSTKSTQKLKPSQTLDYQDQDQTDNEKPKQYLTEFDRSKTQSDSDSKTPKFIIPPQQNEWRPHKRMKNLTLPLSDPTDTELRFETETLSSNTDPDGNQTMSYGLNIRQKDNEVENNKSIESAAVESNTENLLLEKLRYDLKRLPEDEGFEEFKDVPVEGFGAALLAGYGWHEGRGIGRNAKEDVKVKQYVKRTSKEGLGFSSNGSDLNSKAITVGINRNKSDREDNKERNGGYGDGYFVGKDVRVIGGEMRSVGLKGTIVKRSSRDLVVLKLVEAEEELTVRVGDIADLGSKEEEDCLRKLKELKIRKTNRGNEKRASESSAESVKKREGHGGEVKSERDRRRKEVSWLRSHIRVRVISKDLRGGSLYLKKGEVVDVVGPYVCDIAMDESNELVQGLDQDLLETALPRRGGPVLVLSGKHKGAYGNLVQKDLDREIGVVQDSETHEFLNVKLEEVAEYIGDPSYIGY